MAQTLIDGWLANMTQAMGMEIVQQNVTAFFLDTVDQNDTLATYTADFGMLTKYDNWNLFGRQFVADYQARFDGRWPEVDNPVLVAWRLGKAMTAARKAWNEERLVTFEDFVNAKVVPPDNETCTEGLWVYQIEDTGGGVPEYREVLDYDYFPAFKPMRAASLASYAKLVDITVPIGVVPYDSAISLVSWVVGWSPRRDAYRTEARLTADESTARRGAGHHAELCGPSRLRCRPHGLSHGLRGGWILQAGQDGSHGMVMYSRNNAK